MIFFILFCISLVVNDAEHHLMCLFTLCISSSMKCLFMSFAHFLEGLFLLLIFKNSLYILDTNLLSDTKFAYITHIFFQSVNCLISLMGSFAEEEFLILLRLILSLDSEDFVFDFTLLLRYFNCILIGDLLATLF